MFLKSMDMFGFKSFADKTHIEFEPGITAIVGPNGCGKSNVVDAVKWVLGEKQAKNIRGQTMEDIIFSGTDQRKALSLAEVSLTIDNTNRILDFDSEMVTVSRRIFRDGESEYLINKSPVRLKDIDKLFMDTGIGKSAYSVLEQGKMDLILSTKAEDRRYLFEEAAGISRYKMQKKESLKKLQDTGENLNRINDILKEIEREKDLKSRQADKTKEFLNLKGKLSDLDIKVSLIKYRDLVRKYEKNQADIEKLKKEREELSGKVSKTSVENEKDEKRKNDLQYQLFEIEKKLGDYKVRRETIDLATDKNRRLVEENTSRKNSVIKKIEERKENLERLTIEKKKSEETALELKDKIVEDKKKLSEFFETRKRKIDSIHASRDKIEDNNRKIKDHELSLKKLREALEVVIKKLVDAIEKRKIELENSENERQDVKRLIESELSQIEMDLNNAIDELKLKSFDRSWMFLEKIKISVLKEHIYKFESYEDGFRSILFDKTGIHAEKESLDKRIRELVLSIDEMRADNVLLDEFIQNEQRELENINAMITRIERDIAKYENDSNWIEKQIVSLTHQIDDIKKQIDNYNEDIVRTDKIIEDLLREIRESEDKLIQFNEKSEALKKSINELVARRSEIENNIARRKTDSRKDEEELSKIHERLGSLERNGVEISFKRDGIQDYLWTEYEKKVSELSEIKLNDTMINEFQNEIQDLKKKIQDLGPINNLAIQEFRDLKKRFEYYLDQKTDIEKAREDIISVIEDINKTSVEMFISTFNEIQKNFAEMFKRLFEGGEAFLELSEMDNVLESGIDIMVRPPGKKFKNINLLSGGERALTAIALLFATYMVKPSPFCFLDEIDAPLDEQNIQRFVKMLREFSKSTQFIIVTHNKKTMHISESIYGVTMEDPGVSKIISVKMERPE
ncbi:MAG TPA: AAA family ATPase [Spirochaetota bacterium]|nr:AAA family ATPase [Spirochaetota bacterium]HPF06864.1 AAA family ATPase [Spirochaetota bacterium]HPJ43447.1 AAA family ATPase [Spirochaetota bacterium]HPR36145.1 AAA family ATPase [Spirochaetota bacterium]HRX48950.1 AAA family ATPase [Spirochaetota bacterium]